LGQAKGKNISTMIGGADRSRVKIAAVCKLLISNRLARFSRGEVGRFESFERENDFPRGLYPGRGFKSGTTNPGTSSARKRLKINLLERFVGIGR
jgi:hypothetical protein